MPFLLKPRLHQIHVAGYKYPGRATCIRIQVDILSPIQDTCRRRQTMQMDTSGYNLYPVHVSGVNATLVFKCTSCRISVLNKQLPKRHNPLLDPISSHSFNNINSRQPRATRKITRKGGRLRRKEV